MRPELCTAVRLDCCIHQVFKESCDGNYLVNDNDIEEFEGQYKVAAEAPIECSWRALSPRSLSFLILRYRNKVFNKDKIMYYNRQELF